MLSVAFAIASSPYQASGGLTKGKISLFIQWQKGAVQSTKTGGPQPEICSDQLLEGVEIGFKRSSGHSQLSLRAIFIQFWHHGRLFSFCQQKRTIWYPLRP